MTVAQLLTWILAALSLQVVAGVAIALWRRRQAPVAAPGTVAAPATLPREAAWPGTRAFKVHARGFEDASKSQCSFYLVPLDGAPLPAFKPGQFLTFSLQVGDGAQHTGTRAVTRCYSLSDGPTPAHYRVTIKRVLPPVDLPSVPPGVASNHFHDHVQVGTVLELRAPAGHFFIDPDPAIPVVLVAGGIGITPMMSMLQWCVAAQPARRVHLYYGLRHGGEHAFKAALEQVAEAHPSVTLNVVYSRPAACDRPGIDFQHIGHVDVALLKRSLPLGRHQFYVCGPAAMMEALVPALAAWGVPEQDIHFEAFGPASVRLTSAAAPPATSAAVAVQFTRSGRTVDWDGQDANLLDLAERHGIAVDSGCRTGGCGSCETRLLSGSVVYAQRPDHDPAAGHCLLCVGRPASALVLEA